MNLLRKLINSLYPDYTDSEAKAGLIGIVMFLIMLVQLLLTKDMADWKFGGPPNG